MTKPEAIQIFLEISTQLRHEQLLKDGAGVVKAALRGDDGTVYYAELGGANAGDLSMQELAGNATLLYYMSEEAQEGRNAYVEKRRPDFRKFRRVP